MEIIKICPSEGDLSEIHTNVNCTESGCTSVFPNTSSLEMHLIKTHSKSSSFLKKKETNRTFRYFCPVKSCKYEMVQERTEGQLRWFTKHKYLKQHYLQVHKERKFKCPSCSKSFLTEKEKNTHCNMECGIQFACLSCSAMYNTQLALEAHCKRKHHLTFSPIKRSKQQRSLSNKVKPNENRLMGSIKTECPILPKPVNNPIENIAAAALSELSWKIVVRGVDKEVQTVGRRRTPVRSLKKRDSQETQTGDKKPKVSQETQTTASYKNRPRGNRLGTQTQTFHDLFPELSNSPQNPLDDVILPQLYTSSTQTGEQSYFDIKKDLDLDLFGDQQSPRSYSDQIDRLIQSSMLESRSCNIETQTEMDLADSFIEPMLSNTETQTIQNAIDEYSHNYTQTCDDIFLNDFVEFSDIETQTAWASLNVDTGLVSAETQTSI